MKTESNFASYIIIALSLLTLCVLIWKASTSIGINTDHNSSAAIESLVRHQSSDTISIDNVEQTQLALDAELEEPALAQDLEKEPVQEVIHKVAESLKNNDSPVNKITEKPADTIVADEVSAPKATLQVPAENVQTKDAVTDIASNKKVKNNKGKRLPIVFAYDSSELTPQSFPALNKLARKLHIDLAIHISIIGHTDTSGTVESNLRLSLRRAESVRQYLLGRGIASDRMTIDGYGGSQPIADNTNAAGRLENRRIEIIEEIKS